VENPLKTYMDENNLNQSQLALKGQKHGLYQMAISRYLRKTRAMSARNIVSISRTTGIAIETLVLYLVQQ